MHFRCLTVKGGGKPTGKRVEGEGYLGVGNMLLERVSHGGYPVVSEGEPAINLLWVYFSSAL